MEEVTWFSPIVVVPKKNEKFQICVDFQKLNATTIFFLILYLFMEEVLDMVVGHKVYSFLEGFSRCH
jgi:hypothetical protein